MLKSTGFERIHKGGFLSFGAFQETLPLTGVVNVSVFSHTGLDSAPVSFRKMIASLTGCHLHRALHRLQMFPVLLACTLRRLAGSA